jgi:NitT/TauT family transport system ATP-binding protein
MLLMDEPFGALDAQTKARLQKEFLDIWQRLNATVIFVTHDLTEAALLGDRVVVMVSGEIVREVLVPFSRPRNADELRFLPEFQRFVQDLWPLLLSDDADAAKTKAVS